MRRIGIVGAGQSGLQLAIGLRRAGYEVVLVSALTPEAIQAGRVTSSQCMFDSALQAERDIGLGQWARRCPPVEGIEFNVAPERRRAIHWASRLDRPAMSVDQRVKMPAFMREFVRMGGELRILEARLQDMEALTRECELVIVAAGKGAVANIFERNAARSRFDRPMRSLALTYVCGLPPRSAYSAVCFNIVPGVGEYFVFPALTLSGACEIMVFEGIPGGSMDCWAPVRSPEQHLETSLAILRQHLPWEFERARGIELTDVNGILAGRFAPTVRHPIARLDCGSIVLGMADVVCLNDPITGQGSNNASKCAAIYLRRILDHGRAPFDAQWMQDTFEAYWNYASYVTDWTNSMLLPPPPHVTSLLAAAASKPKIARWFVNAFDDPRRFYPYLVDPAAAEQFITAAG